jgi:hypothetical protein
MEQDQNGEVAALIKVVTTQTGFSFDCGAMGIVKTLQKPSEIWVYVPRGVRKITIAHPRLGLLRDYYFPIPIEAARTYELVLISGSVQTIVQQTSRNQYLVLKVTPSNAIVELDNEILPTSNGIAQKFVKLGTYEYRVQAPDYHTAAGIVEVNDPNNKKVVEINLSPAFGWIAVPRHQEYNGAQVYIDNALAGTIPMKSKNLASGEHSIKIVKALYNPYLQTVVVKDNETTQVIPNLSANYSEITVTVDNDADIYINGEYKGRRNWKGKLASGSYLLEAKKKSHRTSSKIIELAPNLNNQTIELSAPSPILGAVNIMSKPAMADVYIDGELKGETPLYIPQILVGNHQVVIKKAGFSNYETKFEITESQEKSISAELNNFILTKVRVINSEASIYIDGKYIGEGNVETYLSIGNHEIIAKSHSSAFFDFRQKENITNNHSTIDVLLEEKEQLVTFSYDSKKKNAAYIYISIDGSDFKTWDGSIFQKKLSTGRHMIVVRQKGYNEIRKTIEVNYHNKTYKVSFLNKDIVPIRITETGT